MVIRKRSFWALLTCGLTLAGCETPQQPNFNFKNPLSSLKAKKEVSPIVANAFYLIKEEKYKEASQFINIALQSQPKNIVFHILNGIVYEKLAEQGDAAGIELAAIGYQNAINIDSSNIFAITQLAKLKIREKQYGEAQEYFANALLIKPNNPDLLHELAAASYYAYDIHTAIVSIDKAVKLKPDDPLIHRSAAMIHAAVGDFNTAKKHFDLFKTTLGDDPAVAHVADRFNDWQTLYQSGRIKLASTTQSVPETNLKAETGTSKGKLGGLSDSSPTSDPTPASSSPSASSSVPASSPTPASAPTPMPNLQPLTPPPVMAPLPPSTPISNSGSDNAPSLDAGDAGGNSDSSNTGDETAQAEFDEIQTEFDQPLSLGSGGLENNPGLQVIVDCYLLRVTEDAQTSKGQNILDNLAVTLTPGGYTTFKGKLKGSGAIPPGQSNTNDDNVATQASTGFKPNQPVSQNAGAASAFTPATTSMSLNNAGTLSGSVFTNGITWAGLTYSLNIANAIDSRTEVVSRPSLMTFLKKKSVFFSGSELLNGVAGQFGGTLIKYPVGITIEVTPEAIVDDLVTFNIAIEGSLLLDPNPNLLQTVSVGKTRVETYLKVHLGETLMLGGIYERVELASKDGFPGLQDVPVVQYFFSNESTRSSRRSIVFMLTPRSPDLVKSAVNRAMNGRNKGQDHLKELSNRNPDWFNPSPNLLPLFKYIANDPIVYYEFRSGDVLPPSWGWEPTINTKLEQLQSFLYY